MTPTLEEKSFNHVVLYQTNPQNPQAVQMIIDNANRYLAHIPGIKSFSVKPRHDSGRAVQGYNFDVGMNFIFHSKAHADEYMRHPDHLKFVEFVLDGWQLKDSPHPDRQSRKEEFMAHILNGKAKLEWMIDSDVPTERRVWAGEQVYDF